LHFFFLSYLLDRTHPNKHIFNDRFFGHFLFKLFLTLILIILLMAKIFRKAVMAVIINDRNQILIGYSPRDKSFKFPQGGLEKNETIILGLQRELLEELNYILQHKFIIEAYTEKINYPFPKNCHPIYKGQELRIVKIKHNANANIIPQDDEFEKMLWIDPKEITNYNTEYRSEAYYQALIICGLV